jgi:hypothetical protein
MKLTNSQFEIVKQCLIQEMQNKVICIGERYGYNEKEVYTSNGVWKNTERENNIYYKDAVQIANKTKGKSLLKANVLTSYVSGAYNKFYSYYKIDYIKLFEYSNGKECLSQAFAEI